MNYSNKKLSEFALQAVKKFCDDAGLGAVIINDAIAIDIPGFARPLRFTINCVVTVAPADGRDLSSGADNE